MLPSVLVLLTGNSRQREQEGITMFDIGMAEIVVVGGMAIALLGEYNGAVLQADGESNV